MTEPASALCARHLDREALITCHRCGSFACGSCISAVWPDSCTVCAPADRERLPWEDPRRGSHPQRFWPTVWALLSRPGPSLRFERWPRPYGPAMQFATTLWGLYGVAFVFALLAVMRIGEGGLGFFGVWFVGTVVLSIVAAIVQALPFALSLALARQPEPFQSALRATAYLQVWTVFGLLSRLLGLGSIALIGTEAPLGSLALSVLDVTIGCATPIGIALGLFGAVRGAGGSATGAWITALLGAILPALLAGLTVLSAVGRIYLLG